MQLPPTQSELDSKRAYYRQQLSEPLVRPYLLNISLISNPFLKDQEQYHFLNYLLTEYNRRVSKSEVKDSYQMLSYHRLQSCLSDLAQMETKADQVNRLEEVFKWAKDQQKLIEQRRDQGAIRYKVTNEWRHLKAEQDRAAGRELEGDKQQQTADHEQIPSELIQRLMGPYCKKARTQHPEIDMPPRRLHQYKRKIINIAPFIQTRQQAKPPRVLYPMPVLVQEIKQDEQPKEGEEGQIKDGQPKEGQAKEGEEGAQDPQDQQQQDLGGFGEEPEEPDEDQKPEEEADDKLAPRVKVYTAAILQDHRKLYRGPYIHYRGTEISTQRSMELRYFKMQQDFQKRQKQQYLDIQTANQRGRNKSKVQKQLQKRLQDMMFKPKFEYIRENPPRQEKLNPKDEAKFGFSIPVRIQDRKYSFDISNKLPKLKKDEFSENSMRRDRLHSLKNKFGKMLNLTEFQSRDTSPSMCQYTSRKRGLSEIMQNHSKSKQRLLQIEEITKIKEKLTRNKLGVNMKALSQGLCLPEDEEPFETKAYPEKALPSNPFMVETKKKKKKK